MLLPSISTEASITAEDLIKIKHWAKLTVRKQLKVKVVKTIKELIKTEWYKCRRKIKS